MLGELPLHRPILGSMPKLDSRFMFDLLDRWLLPFALNRRPPLPSTSPSLLGRCSTHLPPLPSSFSSHPSIAPSSFAATAAPTCRRCLLFNRSLSRLYHRCCSLSSLSLPTTTVAAPPTAHPSSTALHPALPTVSPRRSLLSFLGRAQSPLLLSFPTAALAAIVCTLLPLPLLSPPPICRLQPLRSVAISSLMPLPTPSPSVHNSAASATVLPTTTHSFLSFSAISVTIAVDTLPLKHQQLRATCCSLPTGCFS
ncbi:hypothetical protein BHE74_00039474 [Ensete ventricosum]|nr:hypothetical protein GW17_00057282 [Ensete ventricosum]RWW53987.1 hypothetical protein BHE74_00039474 [Ensete ventricosum]